MAVLLPGAPDLATYWHNLQSGHDAITEVPPQKWDPDHYAPGEQRADRVYCRRGGFVDEFAEVDVTSFGVMPNSVPSTEPDQLIALAVAAQALDDAGGTDRLPEDRSRVGVVLGRGGYLTPALVRLDQRVRTASQLVRTLGDLVPTLGEGELEAVRTAFTDQLGPESPEGAIGLVPNLAASRLANRLDLRGPAYTVDAACASSLIAVDQAVQELSTGRCDVMLAGGVHHCHDITFWSVFSQLGALSRSEQIRPFHKDADGVLIGEGTGVVVLKRLADAQRDGDRIYATITGTGVASDGRTASLFNPDSGGQVRAVRQAWARAGVDPRDPDSIGLLEAHGTATPAGDAAELATLREVFGATGHGVLGSVKSMIGHTMPAAGVAGLVKAALAVHHGVLPPTLHCEQPHPDLAATRFTTLDVAKPWDTPVRRAGVNAFGFGGINAHVVLEQPPAQSGSAGPDAADSVPISVREPERILRLTADSVAQLQQLFAEAAAGGVDDPGAPPADGPVRLGIVDPTQKRLDLAHRALAKGKAWRGRNDVWFTDRPMLGAAGGKIAFMFPGLESELALNCGDLAQHLGLPWSHSDARVGDIGRHGLAVFELGRLLNAAMARLGVAPDAVGGHSLGEWTAMVAAGIFADEQVESFLADYDPDTIVVPGVAFAAVGAAAERVAEGLAELPNVVISHDNSPNQTLVCGPEADITLAVEEFRQSGIIAQVLPFQSGFHTPMLEPYLDPIREAASGSVLYPPKIPIWSATLVAEYPDNDPQMRELFFRHLLERVRFRPLIEAMHAAGFRAFVQLGAGQLGSLVGDTLSGDEHLVVSAHSSMRSGLAQMRRVATGLWVDGADVDFTVLPGESRGTSGTPGAAGPGPRPKRPVKLDLGARLVSLDDSVRAQLALPEAPISAPPPELAQLSLAGPIGAELAALLADTAELATSVLSASTTPASTTPAATTPAATTPGSTESATVEPAGLASGATESASAPEPVAAEPSRPRELSAKLAVSMATMPYLIDHCFFKQPPQAEVADRWPIVPATTVIHHLTDYAQQAAPGLAAVAVHDVRLTQWITAEPAIEVDVHVTPLGDDRVRATLQGYSEAIVELAATYDDQRPDPWVFPAAIEEAPTMPAEQLYADRWMFHGPHYRGLHTLLADGDAHVRALLTTPPAPGALLDNVGQVLGYWIISRYTERTTVFPIGMREIRFFGPHPAPGEQLECLIKITELTDDLLVADMQLVHEGEVWAAITGWHDRRFDSTPKIHQAARTPETHLLSVPHQAGWTLTHEQWPDLASRELIMRNYLAGPERSEYASRPPRGKRQWLLGRIAAKDAVRTTLWAEGESEMFPAELRIGNDPSGRPTVTGALGREFPELTISIAHRAEVGVAIARHGRCGIDVEEVTSHPASMLEVALTPAEQSLLSDLSARPGGDQDTWFTRFWCAKEAVAKLLGTGLQGEPRNFEVTGATQDRLTVRSGAIEYEVRCADLRNLPSAPPRQYVVAWTEENKEIAP